jgi:hypothetical protein
MGIANNEGQNRFFPTLGNHDYEGSQWNIPYLNFFTLPGNEIYYDFIWGPIHFFAIDSDIEIPKQKLWFYECHTPIDESKPIYLINGLGGKTKQNCGEQPLSSNQFDTYCYDADYGSIFVIANDSIMNVQFVNVDDLIIDEFNLEK